MIYKEKKFIFVHIYKTGGKSLQDSLFPYIDRIPIYYKVFNKLATPLHIKWFPKYLKIHMHSGVTVYRDYLGNEFDNYFKFAVSRNPFSWQVSLYFFMRENFKHKQHKLIMSMDFDEYIKWRCNEENLVLQKSFLVDESGKNLMNFIGKLENLKEDTQILSEKLNLPLLPPPHLGSTKHKHYSDYYTKKTADLIRKNFEEDFEFFEYSFDI